jgi:aerobic-type carbon monoxide dehydrogenase small subunit (CoxS/CutS family)
MKTIFTLNDEQITIDTDAGDMLLHALRDELHLTSVRGTCGIGLCGTCTVIVDGKTTASCLMPVPMIAGCDVRTIENAVDDPVVKAFEDAQGFQCGFCTPAMILTSKQLLEENPSPSEDEIDAALAGNICRCGCYFKIRDAVNLAAVALAERSGS